MLICALPSFVPACLLWPFPHQDVYPAAKGAFTGAVAPGMLSSLGCSYVLAGHSERRVLWGESDEEINKKVRR